MNIIASEKNFTAVLAHNDQVLMKNDSSDFQDLLINLLTHLEDDYPNANGMIIDNRIGETIYRCRKATCYE
jgi:hypothetical protein